MITENSSITTCLFACYWLLIPRTIFARRPPGRRKYARADSQ